METTDLTCWYNHPLLLCDAVGWGGILWATPWLWIRGLVGQWSPITVTHVSGPFSHTAVHWGFTAMAWNEENMKWLNPNVFVLNAHSYDVKGTV